MEDSGIYALLIRCDGVTIRVGALGELQFDRGYYVYIGSAQRNMQKRIARHMRSDKKIKWHIDYLLQHARVVDVHTVSAPKNCEEFVAIELGKKYRYVPGFGASDSHAKSHLFTGIRDNLWNDAISLMRRCKND
uniref:GIY-YIG domain-containing protein n=1 Tax=uncultured euryarchaeote Alv-FOS1 TaxID=337892 RepID=Q3SAA6_9EURY|nr:hypothetical protein [uncultured euryarchaeote Alv-FOS1]